MNPLQEYYLRNNVRAPYVFYGSSQVILHNPNRMKSSDRYKFLDIKAINKEGHDGVNIGKFDITISIPHKSTTSFFTKDDEWHVYWNEYEDHIIKKMSEWRISDWRALGRLDELKMACWELLSYTHDSRFAELPIPLLDLNYKILDCNMPFETRVSLIDRLIEHITLHAEAASSGYSSYQTIITSWSELSNLVKSQKYAHWLVNLLAKG